MRGIISRNTDLRRTCFFASISVIFSHNATQCQKKPLHQHGPAQSLLSLDVWFGSQSAGLCVLGSTFCSVLNHKSSLDRLCTLNRHISHITSLGMYWRQRHPSTVSRLKAGGEGKWILIRLEANQNIWCSPPAPASKQAK